MALDIIKQLTIELNLGPSQVSNTVALFKDGATVPFIARYRKERTGNLNEDQIRDIEHKYKYYLELEDRKTTIIDSIKEQGKLTPDLEIKINACMSKTELEDLYLPYKPKRATRATKAKDAGLEPLARWLVDLQDASIDPLDKASEFVNADKGYDTPLKAVTGACDILAEELSENADHRKWMRDLALRRGLLIAAVKKEFKEQKTKFEMYYDYKEPVKTLAAHRVLAMFRGEKEKVLSLSLDLPLDEAHRYLEMHLIKFPHSGAASYLKTAVKDCFERLLGIATETEIRVLLRERAEDEAFVVFTDNLRTLLLAPPAGQKPVMGVDPGFRTGCKVVTIDATGKFLEYHTIFPNEPQKKTDEARMVVLALIQRFGVKMIAIGNGTAGRETETFIKKTIEDIPEEHRPRCVMVSEAGASVYSASEVAKNEFPDQDVTVRGAVSIGRRLQDPLSELVKIDPKSIGVGQYQHDVNQSRLKERLEEVVESCVNRVGVDVNLASEELLKYVAGLNRSTAKKIVSYRNEHGTYPSREALKKVPGLGEKTFEQAAGFLRIPDAYNPLDNSAVHPEAYLVVKKIALSLDTTVKDLIGNVDKLRKVDINGFVEGDTGLLTLQDILKELEKPGRDPRAEFTYAHFSDTVHEIKDLTEGMVLEGSVTNVTNFGAFVDIGVHQDGMVHVSELSDSFIKDPLQVVRVGQVVKVRVLKVDAELKRISLSMKSDTPPPKPRQEPRTQQQKRPQQHGHLQRRPQQKPLPPKPPVRHSTLEDLKAKFNQDKKKDPKKLFTIKPKININDLIG
ncbi:MAG: RNA-binding transcriptional accessory protein [Chitinispirillaceae bacterium]|nr:RNA-binding transcriptional accessory protein [Chitinispirillaceae bacterium]